MNLLLVTNQLNQKNGYVSLDGDKDDFINFMKKEFSLPPSSSFLARMFYDKSIFSAGYSLFKFATRSGGLKINEFPSLHSDESDIRQLLFSKSILITKKTIKDSSLAYDHEYFKGMFPYAEQYAELIKRLPSDDSCFIISDVNSVMKALNCDLLDVGIYFLSKENSPKRLNNYSESVWGDIKDGIVRTFINLNATKISISDKTKISGNAECEICKEIFSLAPKFGINLKKRDLFNFEMELSGVLNTEKAKNTIDRIAYFPELRSFAEHIIDNPYSGKRYEGSIQLDVSFGVDVNLLALFQGAFEAGYSRRLNICIEFN